MITYEDEMEKLLPERRARIEAKTQELLREVKIIQEVREKLGLSQQDLEERLSVQQPANFTHYFRTYSQNYHQWRLHGIR
jgi:hypothetical protein